MYKFIFSELPGRSVSHNSLFPQDACVVQQQLSSWQQGSAESHQDCTKDQKQSAAHPGRSLQLLLPTFSSQHLDQVISVLTTTVWTPPLHPRRWCISAETQRARLSSNFYPLHHRVSPKNVCLLIIFQIKILMTVVWMSSCYCLGSFLIFWRSTLAISHITAVLSFPPIDKSWIFRVNIFTIHDAKCRRVKKTNQNTAFKMLFPRQSGYLQYVVRVGGQPLELMDRYCMWVRGCILLNAIPVWQ